MCDIKNKLLHLQFVRKPIEQESLSQNKDNKAKHKQQKYEDC